MTPAFIVKFRPVGPWRSGPASGARNRVDPVFHSDSLFSAVTGAMASLGWLDGWLDATARAEIPAVRLGSCFPFMGRTMFAAPPRSVWPPPVSPKVGWNGARFVPLDVIDSLLHRQLPDDDKWAVDGASECLVRPGQSGPFRVGMRGGAAVDRLGAGVEPHAAACLEFAPNCGLWTVIAFSGEPEKERWSTPVRNALRLLADAGVGGERARGWGRSAPPEFVEGDLSALLLPRLFAKPSGAPAVAVEVPAGAAPAEGDSLELSAEANFWEAVAPAAPDQLIHLIESTAEPAPAAAEPAAEQAYWLLSLFVPAPADEILWDRGNYGVVTRAGRIESPAGSGGLKKAQTMIEEGSVVVAPGAPAGSAPDVAPDGFPHPVYRAGFAVAVPLPATV